MNDVSELGFRGAGRVLLAVMIFPGIGLAQTDRGTIEGYVMDGAGRGVPEARVEITWLDTHDILQLRSNEVGRFFVPNLPIGRYEVGVEKEGFRSVSRGGLALEAQGSIRVDFVLEIGAVHERVEISSDSPVLTSSNPTLVTTLSDRHLQALPLITIGEKRDITAYLKFLPNVSGSTAWGARVNGANGGNSEVFLDGAPASQGNARGSIRETGPAVETIGEFSVVANAFNAEYGRTGSWFMNIAMKSGALDLHGSAFDHLNNDALNARSFFQAKRTRLRQNEGGLTLSGPLRIPRIYNRRNNTFFFLGQHLFYYRRSGGTTLATVPTDSLRMGDFRSFRDSKGEMIPVFDPSGTRADGEGGFVREPFPDNVIPASRISSVSRRMLGYILPPDIPDQQAFNYRLRNANVLDTRVTTIKVDHNLTPAQQLAVMHTMQSRPARYTGRGWGLGLPVDGTEDPKNVESFMTRVNHDWVVLPSLLNHFTAGADKMVNRAFTSSLGEGWNERFGIRGLPADAGMFPEVNFSNGTSSPLGLGGTNYSRNASARVSFTDNLAWVRSRHSMKFGFSYHHEQYNNFEGGASSGVFGFSSLTTSQPNSPQFSQWGSSFASFLLGDVDNTRTLTPSALGWRTRHLALFAQDEWRLRRFALSYGVRWERYPGVIEVHDRASSFDPAARNPAAGGRPGALVFAGAGPGRIGRRAFADTWSGFAPRLGITYELDRRTVLRASGGVYFAPGMGPRLSSYGFSATPSFRSSDSFSPVYNWDETWPQNWTQPPVIDPSFQNGQSVSGILREAARPPQIVSWTMSVQRKLAKDVDVEGTYIGSKSTHLELGGTPYGGPDLSSYLNVLDVDLLSLGSVLYLPIDSPEAAAAGFHSPFPGFEKQANNTVGQALRPFPQYMNVTQLYSPEGVANYHSLQVKTTVRYRSGLTLLAFYTWSKNMTDTDCAVVDLGRGPGLVQNPAQRRGEYSVSADGPPHVVVAHGSYELPFGPGKKFAAGKGVRGLLLGGWQVAGYFRRTSGLPLSIAVTNTLTALGFYQRADYVAGRPVYLTSSPRSFDPARDRYLNPAAFAHPGSFRLGNTARQLDWARGWGGKSESVSVSKRMGLTERAGVILRADVENPFNFVRWNNPLTNASDAAFGKVTGAQNGRMIQLTLSLEF